MDADILARFREQLEARRAELTSLSDTSAEARSAVTLDQQSVGRLSRMDAMQGQAMAQAQERQRAGELVRIERALAKIEEGEFGFCEDCGDDIAPKRLEADPTVRLCIHCATSSE